MRYAVMLVVLAALVGCVGDMALPNERALQAVAVTISSAPEAPSDAGDPVCLDRLFGPCCGVKTGCTDIDRAGGYDCVSPPDDVSPGICIRYGTCGNPGNICCDANGTPGGDALCEYNYHCVDGRCQFHGL